MEIREVHPDENLQEEICLALGNFDGLHLAHQELIHEVVTMAKKLGTKSSVLMFKEHTKNILNHKNQQLLMSRRQKLDCFASLGIDLVLEIEFSEIQKMPAEDFFTEFLRQGLQVKGLVIGYDYRFGYKAKGTSDLLKKMAEDQGVQIKIVQEILKDGEAISSTRIRKAIGEGNLDFARKLLGRPFTMEGTVIHGKRLGREMGYPTANIEPSTHYVIPRFGVYDTQVMVDGKSYRAATSVGTNPTLDEEGLKIEAHLLDFTGDLYGKKVDLTFLKFLRPEKNFPSIESLFDQIAKDVEMVEKRK